MSRKQLHKLLFTVSSPEDFARLELCYRSEPARYQALAQQEEAWRFADAVPWEKSPRRSESAKRRAEYYQQVATRDAELAVKYKRTVQTSQQLWSFAPRICRLL